MRHFKGFSNTAIFCRIIVDCCALFCVVVHSPFDLMIIWSSTSEDAMEEVEKALGEEDL